MAKKAPKGQPGLRAQLELKALTAMRVLRAHKELRVL